MHNPKKSTLRPVTEIRLTGPRRRIASRYQGLRQYKVSMWLRAHRVPAVDILLQLLSISRLWLLLFIPWSGSKTLSLCPLSFCHSFADTTDSNYHGVDILNAFLETPSRPHRTFRDQCKAASTTTNATAIARLETTIITFLKAFVTSVFPQQRTTIPYRSSSFNCSTTTLRCDGCR